MIFVYIDGRKSLAPVWAAIDWMKEKIGPESPTTWFRVHVDNADIFALGNERYRHMKHAWVIVDHDHATAFKLMFMSEKQWNLDL